jgi:hypothetical protein
MANSIFYHSKSFLSLTILNKTFCRYSIFFFFLSFRFVVRAQSLNWTETAPGVWKVSVGKPEAYTLLTAAGSQPNRDALKKLGTTAFPLSKNDISVRVKNGKTCTCGFR